MMPSAIDVAFDLRAVALPADYAWPLLTALGAVLPWLAEEPHAGVHPLRVSPTVGGEVLLAARAMHAGLGVLKPALARVQTDGGAKPVVVLGTVRGDLHDIGKNLIAMMLEAGGFVVVDLGTNVSVDRFTQAVKEHRPAVLALSALLTTTMREMKKTIEHLRQAGVMDGVKTIVGGAPVTEEFARTIGADGWGPDAPTAVAMTKRLVHTA
jgi:5-methyltetrahydrofolate--homocysteine methyltransferase